MKTCKHCKITVGGEANICPLCQTKLKGENDEPYFPYKWKPKQIPLAIKILIFLLLSACVVFLILDLTYSLFDNFHPSIMTLVWIICILITTKHYIKNHRSIPKMIFGAMVLASLLTYITGKVYGFEWLAIDYIIPIWCCLTLIVNFVFCLIKAVFAESALIFMLLNIIVGIISYITILINNDDVPVSWMICLLLSIITFIGIAVFKGKTVFYEIQKRMHL